MVEFVDEICVGPVVGSQFPAVGQQFFIVITLDFGKGLAQGGDTPVFQPCQGHQKFYQGKSCRRLTQDMEPVLVWCLTIR